MSKLSNLLPLIVLFAFIGGGAYIGYQIYLWSNEMTDRGKKHMEKKNIAFSKDGLKVGVKDVGSEAYEDKTQNVLVNVWNNANYGDPSKRPSSGVSSNSRTASSSGVASNLSPPASRGTEKRSTSPLPGGFS